MSNINGKPLSEVLLELSKEKKPNKLLLDKYPYWSIEEYEKRLSEVVGRQNYRATYALGESLTFPNGQVLMTVSCRLSLLDENGTEVFFTEGIGGREAKWSENNSQYLALNCLTGNARMNAFKDACKGFNIFNCHRYDESDEGEGEKKASGKTKSTAATQSSEVTMNILTETPMVNVRDDVRTGKPVYRVLAREIVDDKRCREEQYMIVFYPNQYAKGKELEKMNEYLITLTDGKPHKCKLVVSYLKEVEGVQQYLFKKFA